MVSSKGKPTKPQLREKIKNQLQKENGGGGWAAWMGAELSKRYEAQGGGYEETEDNTNKANKGIPEPESGVDKASGGAAVTQKRENEQKENEKKQADGQKPASANTSKKRAVGGDKKKGADKPKGEAVKKDGKKKNEPPAKKTKIQSSFNPAPSKKASTKPKKKLAQGERKQPSRGAKN